MKRSNKRFQENKKTVSLLFAGSTALLFISFYCIFRCMAMIEERQGAVIQDFLHPFLPPPIDLSTWIFTATYSATIIFLVHILRQGLYVSAIIFIAFAALLFFRCVSIWAVPLDPPPDMIALDDTFVRFFNPENFVYSKDLFFSGHTASMFSFCLIARDKRLKTFLLVLTAFVVVAISIQRVHYTIDILGGIGAAYVIFFLVQVLEKRLWHLCHEPVVQKVPVKSVVNVNKKGLANYRT